MDSDENLSEGDPDYIKNNSSERIKEENEREHSPNSGKSSEVYSLLSGIFNEELLKRQQQLEDIEKKIRSAQKTLHLMRYVQITSYYKKSLDITNNENTNINHDNQNRIHPALKKLLGGNSQLDIFTSGKRRTSSKVCDISETSTSQFSATKRKKLENKVEAPKIKSEDDNKKSMRNRRKTQHRIIIGNISKWMPSSEEGNTTHKWKMYVRGDKESPDVSDIVDKVIFYLHSSYKPHDIVPVENPPFHLSRRGWGEFPLKVEIFFKCSLNKPISIVHNLKLDKRYTGRQTLGNETVVDVDLYDDIESSKPSSITEPRDESSNIPSNDFVLDSPMEIEECNIDSKELCNFDSKLAQHSILESLYAPPDFSQHDSAFSETCSLFDRSDSNVTNSHSDSVSGQFDSVSVRSNEHDYCQDIDIVEEQFVFDETEPRYSSFLEYFNFEHSYCLPVESENSHHECDNSEKYTIDKNVQDETQFIFGLDDNYLNDGIRRLPMASTFP